MSIKLSQVAGDLEIDVDIEKKITQLQEAKLAGEIERPEQLSIDPEKQLTEWHLEKGLKTFLANVEFEKEDLSKKIEQEDAKIKALEEMFGGLINKPKTEEEIELENTEVISEESFNELSEEEKKQRARKEVKRFADQCAAKGHGDRAVRHSIDLRLQEVDQDFTGATDLWTWMETKWTPGGWLSKAEVEAEIDRLQKIARGGYELERGKKGARTRQPMAAPAKAAFFFRLFLLKRAFTVWEVLALH
mgnify:CR=1 FL=1